MPGLHISDDPHGTARTLTGDVRSAARVIHLTLDPATAADSTPPTLTTITVHGATTGPVWHIAADGTTRTPDNPAPGRLCVLPARTAVDLIRLTAHARGLTPTLPATTARPTPVACTARTAEPDRHLPARLDVLGTCRLTITATPITISRSAAWQTLVLLAAHPDGATTAQLIEAIWPGLPAATITGRLYTTLNHLRTQTRPALHGHDLITHEHGRYRLNPDTVDTDLHHLNNAITDAAQALTTHERHTAHQAVITAYHGDLAATHSWPWLHHLREHLTHHVLAAYTTLAAASPPDQAITLLRDAIAIDPYNHNVHQLAIRALHDAGDHTAATALQDAHTQRLLAGGLEPRSRPSAPATKPS